MTAPSLRLLWAYIMVATCPHAQGANPSWPFGVTPTCTPRVSVLLGDLSSDGHLRPLVLSHRLIFDGNQYVSQLYIPLIATNLVYDDTPDTFVLTDIDGEVESLTSRQVIRLGANGVKINRRPNITVLYQHCRPSTLTIGETTVRYIWTENAVSIVESISGRSLVDGIFDERGRVTHLTLPNSGFTFEYAVNGSIATCFDSKRTKVFSATYDQQLLSSFEHNSVQLRYVWGRTTNDYYFNDLKMPEPSIINDGFFSYTSSFNHGFLVVKFRSQEKVNSFGKWIFNPKTGKINLLQTTAN